MASPLLLYTNAHSISLGKWFKSVEGVRTVICPDYRSFLLENDLTRQKSLNVRLTIEYDLSNVINLFHNLIVLEEARQDMIPNLKEMTLIHLGPQETLYVLCMDLNIAILFSFLICVGLPN